MKRAWLAFVILLAIIAIAIVGYSRKGNGDVMSDFRPYASNEQVIYYDPADFLKMLPKTALTRMTSRDLQPIELHYLKVNKLRFRDICRVARARFNRDPKWEVVMEAPSDEDDGGRFSAYRSDKPSSTGAPDPDVTFLVQSIYPSIAPVPGQKLPISLRVVLSRRMSPWEVTWLKIKHLGRPAFASEEDLMKLYTQ